MTNCSLYIKQYKEKTQNSGIIAQDGNNLMNITYINIQTNLLYII